jgi:HEAT repeat protein
LIDQEGIHNQCLSKDPKDRIKALEQLKDNFSLLSDKQQAWNDLIRLTADADGSVRYGAASALGSAFSEMPDKQQAWNDLIRLTADEDGYVRDGYVRSRAASALGSAFSKVPDKQQAWNDLHKLTADADISVRSEAAFALGSAFSEVPDKQQAWNDLHKLTADEDGYVRFRAASALGSAFSEVPDKQQAWNDLHELIADEDKYVRSGAAYALGSAFSKVSDKQQAWNDLIRLTANEDRSVRVYVNHSLGKVSIFKASQAEKEEDYKRELETAISFFEKAAQESEYLNPSSFCLPFYRSFHAIIFEKQEAKEEVDKHLEEAKAAVRGSKSKELLLEAVNNLANALKEVHKLESMDLEAKKGELNFYRQYCDRVTELMKDAEKTAPFATIAVRKGLLILNRNLKELLEEIQNKTEVIREQTKGTPFEKLGDELNKESLSLLQVRDLVGFKKQIQNLENKLNSMCSKLPEGQKGEACELLKTIHEEHSIEDKIPLINDVLSKFSYQLDMISCLNRIDASLSSVNKKVEEITISLKPEISEELIIHVGPITQWGGIEYTMTIPLQDISYPELKEDLQKIVGKKVDKFSKMPENLANKVRDYLVQKKMWSILDNLT